MDTSRSVRFSHEAVWSFLTDSYHSNSPTIDRQRRSRPQARAFAPCESSMLLPLIWSSQGPTKVATTQAVRDTDETTLANRFRALTDVGNRAERRSLERAGCQLEGILRGAGFLGGRWRDGTLYARLRNDQ